MADGVIVIPDPAPAAVPVAVIVMLLVPSVLTVTVSLNGVLVGVLAVGANVMMSVHVPCGWTTTTTVPMQVPEALKSGELLVFTPVKPRGPSPVLVMVIGADCALLPAATGVGKFTVAVAGEGVPGGDTIDRASTIFG